jgi:tetratricopeptide (TPR) repeat protein
MMHRTALAFSFALLWVGGTEPPRPRLVLRSLLAVAREANDPGKSHPSGCSAAAPAGEGATDDGWSAAELERIAARVREAIREKPHMAPVDVLSETIFATLGFVREVDDNDLRFVLLPSVLRSKRGSCVGLGSMYLALGEALGWPSAGVMVPGHFFVRMEEGGRVRNVELLRRGEEMPDTWYAARFPAHGSGARAYMRSLTLSEVVGVIEYDIGNDRRRRGRLVEARTSYARATIDFPTFAEAQASLGTTLHLLGALREAEATYRLAKRVDPYLPGVDSNLELLLEERNDEAISTTIAPESSGRNH